MSYRGFNVTIPPILDSGIVYYCYNDNQCKGDKNGRYMNQILINSKFVKDNDPSVSL